jgi:HlyD family secretion protein
MALATPKRLLLILIPVAVVAAILLTLGLTRRPRIPVAVVQRGEFAISITRSGEVKAGKSITIAAPSVGEQVIITRLVPEGTFVKKGDLLVQFDPTGLLERLESAQRELVAAQADLELNQAQDELRKKELLEDIRKKEIASARAEGGPAVELEEARQELSLARARYETDVKVMEVEAVKTEVNIGRARERVAEAKKSLQELTVTAPGDGIVVHERVWRSGRNAKVQEGDSPWPMQPIISLPDLGTLYVATDVDEIDISRMQVGQTCLLTLDAYPDTTFQGHIDKIGNLARSKYYDGGPNVFDVSVELDQTDARFRPGMMTKVKIMIEVFQDQVFLPIEAVFDSPQGTVAYVKRGSSFEERLLQVGSRNDTHIIVRSGLESGEEVALASPVEKSEE